MESSPDHEEVALFGVTAHPRACVKADLRGEQDWEMRHVCCSDQQAFTFFSTEKKRVKREREENRKGGKKGKGGKETLIRLASAFLQQAGLSSASLPASVKLCYVFLLIFKVGSNYLSCF